MFERHPALNALGNASYLAIALGFLVTDLLALRALLSSEYLGLICFHSLQKKPLWVSFAAPSRPRALRAHRVHTVCVLAQVPLAWSCVFIAVNAAAASAIAADRWPGTLTPEEHQLHQLHFAQLTPGEFKQPLGLAERRTLPHGQELTRESVPARPSAPPCSCVSSDPCLSPTPHPRQVPCDRLYYIVQGRCKLYLRAVRRREIARDHNPRTEPQTEP